MQHLLNKYPLLSLNPVPATMWALSCALLSALLLSISTSAQGQTSQRWFQIEVSIFSNESLADRDEERWQTESNELNYPNPLRRLGQLSDLLITEQMIADAIAESSEQDSLSTKEEATIEIDADALAAIERLAQITAILNRLIARSNALRNIDSCFTDCGANQLRTQQMRYPYMFKVDCGLMINTNCRGQSLCDLTRTETDSSSTAICG
jgi:hypothetical protein